MRRIINRYLDGKERPLLNGGLYNGYYEIRTRRKRRGYYAIIFTALCLLVALAILLLGIVFDQGGDLIDPDMIPTISEGILRPSKDTILRPSETDGESTEEDTTQTDTESTTDIYEFDYSKVPSGETPIVPMDLSLSNYGALYIHNSTGYSPNTEQLISSTLDGLSGPEYISTSLPAVLIIHTHGTEAFCEDGAIGYKENANEEFARTDDIKNNIVAVGKTLSDALNKKGINTIHCEIMHDEDGYRTAYDRAKETIEEYIKKYPSIKLVIDLHRDAIINSDGDIIRPITSVSGKTAAQVMCVVGSSYGGEENKRWEDNLSLALQLREQLNKDNTNLCRPVYLKSSTYNQEIARYSLLLEVGACGNSLDEAKYTATLVADAIAKIIK